MITYKKPNPRVRSHRWSVLRHLGLPPWPGPPCPWAPSAPPSLPAFLLEVGFHSGSARGTGQGHSVPLVRAGGGGHLLAFRNLGAVRGPLTSLSAPEAGTAASQVKIQRRCGYVRIQVSKTSEGTHLRDLQKGAEGVEDRTAVCWGR